MNSPTNNFDFIERMDADIDSVPESPAPFAESDAERVRKRYGSVMKSLEEGSPIERLTSSVTQGAAAVQAAQSAMEHDQKEPELPETQTLPAVEQRLQAGQFEPRAVQEAAGNATALETITDMVDPTADPAAPVNEAQTPEPASNSFGQEASKSAQAAASLNAFQANLASSTENPEPPVVLTDPSMKPDEAIEAGKVVILMPSQDEHGMSTYHVITPKPAGGTAFQRMPAGPLNERDNQDELYTDLIKDSANWKGSTDQPLGKVVADNASRVPLKDASHKELYEQLGAGIGEGYRKNTDPVEADHLRSGETKTLPIPASITGESGLAQGGPSTDKDLQNEGLRNEPIGADVAHQNEQTEEHGGILQTGEVAPVSHTPLFPAGEMSNQRESD